jgi:hypothetical protein
VKEASPETVRLVADTEERVELPLAPRVVKDPEFGVVAPIVPLTLPLRLPLTFPVTFPATFPVTFPVNAPLTPPVAVSNPVTPRVPPIVALLVTAAEFNVANPAEVKVPVE